MSSSKDDNNNNINIGGEPRPMEKVHEIPVRARDGRTDDRTEPLARHDWSGGTVEVER